MRPAPSTWVMLEVGMYVQGTDGSTWRVDEKDMAYEDHPGWRFALVNRAGQRAIVIKQPEDPVTLMVPTHEDAEAMWAAHGTVIERRFRRMEEVEGGRDTKNARSSLAAHLLYHHGVSISPTAHVENGSMADLLEAHALAHSSTRPMPFPHVHVPQEML